MTATTGSSAPDSQGQARDAGVRRRPDIVYAVRDGIELRGDLYVPQGPGPFPVVVAAPGGAWAVCDRLGLRHWGDYLARNGYAVFSIQYRVAAERKMFPEAVSDVVSAVQFVRGSAAELEIDAARMALLGSSAGAHLAALAALAGDAPLFKTARPGDANAAVSPAVKAFLGVYGAYDLLAAWQDEIRDYSPSSVRRTEALLGVPPYEDRQLYFDASPISHVRYAANPLAVFLAWGVEDDLVRPATQSEPFLRALKQAGFRVRSYPVPGAGHFWFSEEPVDEPGSHAGYLAPRLLRFLRQNL